MSKLLRSVTDRKIAGVCAGIAECYGWSVRRLRLVWAILSVVGLGSPVLFYLVLWIVMPNAGRSKSYAERMNERLGKK